MQIVESLALAADEGVTEFIWDLNVVGCEPARQVELLEALAEAIDLGSGSSTADNAVVTTV